MRLALYVGVLLLGALAAWVSVERPYTSKSDLGYYLGLVGGCMMLSLLFYPLRKHSVSYTHLTLPTILRV